MSHNSPDRVRRPGPAEDAYRIDHESQDRPVQHMDLEAGLSSLSKDLLSADATEALLRAALPHWLDEAVLRVLFGDCRHLDSSAILNELQDLSFVTTRQPGVILLHATVRKRILDDWRSRDLGVYRSLSRRLWKHYAGQAISGDLRFVIKSEAMYHRFPVEPQGAFRQYATAFQLLIDAGRVNDAENLNRGACEQSWTQRWPSEGWLRYHEALLFEESGDYERCDSTLAELRSLIQLHPQQATNELNFPVVAHQGICCHRRGAKGRAGCLFEEALSILAGWADITNGESDIYLACTYAATIQTLICEMGQQAAFSQLLFHLSQLSLRWKAYKLAEKCRELCRICGEQADDWECGGEQGNAA